MVTLLTDIQAKKDSPKGMKLVHYQKLDSQLESLKFLAFSPAVVALQTMGFQLASFLFERDAFELLYNFCFQLNYLIQDTFILRQILVDW